MPDISLSWPQVLAWRLQQQHLTARAPHQQMLDVISRICGLQAQVMSAATLGVWARVADVTAEEVANALWLERTLVKLWAMRGTLHLLPTRDVPLYVAAARPTRRGYTRPSWLKYHGVTADELAAILEAARTVLSDQPITRAQFAEAVIAQTGSSSVGDALRSGWGAVLKPASTHGYLCFGPSQGQNVTFVNPQRWLREWQEVEDEAAIAEVVRRYLHVYAPATHSDFARWWGVDVATGKRMFRRLSAETVELTVEGWRGWALADDVAALQQARGTTNVRLLPNFDHYVIASNRDLTAILPAQYKARVYRIAGWISPVLLVNGAVAGVWQYNTQRGSTNVRVEPFSQLSGEVEALVAAEAAHLGKFLGSPTNLTYGPLTNERPDTEEPDSDEE